MKGCDCGKDKYTKVNSYRMHYFEIGCTFIRANQVTVLGVDPRYREFRSCVSSSFRDCKGQSTLARSNRTDLRKI